MDSDNYDSEYDDSVIDDSGNDNSDDSENIEDDDNLEYSDEIEENSYDDKDDEDLPEDIVEKTITETETKNCIYVNNDIDNDEFFDDDTDYFEKNDYMLVDKSDRISRPVMTYYEMVRIIGNRAQQLNYGAKPLIDSVEKISSAQTAYLELLKGLVPFIIRRKLPKKKYEEWSTDELSIVHEIDDEFFLPKNLKK